ncbi:hypothetical protein Tco_1045031 [Tanacetum coccineum]|uniref:Transposase (putative) gypsy type domain-containing protein n=1 Tax=Tanacetum coccineum TaxID=301880 RepID=A0ABQ5GRL0_9ASTR
MIAGTVYHDLYLGGKALAERENMGFDTLLDAFASVSLEDPPARRAVGLRMVGFPYWYNHPEDDYYATRYIRISESDSITTQTCELSQEEFNDFLAHYLIPSKDHVNLPKSNQTIFEAPPGYVGLYTQSFSLANLRLPLTEFFCEVLEYFQVHISRLNPFGCAKLTTFVVMYKAYGYDPSVDLF